jgi:hypothetical protein
MTAAGRGDVPMGAKLLAGRPHGRIAAGVVGLAIMLVGCGGTDEPPMTPSVEAGAGAAPTVDSLTGVWLRSGHALFVLFTRDGRFAADPVRDSLQASPYGAGTYEIDGNTITFVFAATPICTEGDTSVWVASQPEPDRLEVDVTEDGSGDCRWVLGEQRFIRIGDS